MPALEVKTDSRAGVKDMGSGLRGRWSFRCRSRQFAALCLLCLWIPGHAAAATPPGRYALATAHPFATDTGQQILASGGNAFDAAVAVAAMLSVVEPYSAGMGGGGFWLLHIAEAGKNITLDARECAPLSAHRDMYLNTDGNVIPRLSVDGALAAGIPGVPAALAYLARTHGRLPLSATLAPAIKVARQGFPVDEKFIRRLQRRQEVIREWPSSVKVFLDEGNMPKPGYLIRQPELADTLQRVADRGRDGFYRGQIAEKLVAGVVAAGGIWQLQDLADYRVALRTPVRFTWRDAEIFSAPPPSSGGIVLAQIFNILSSFDVDNMSSEGRVHFLTEAMRLAYRDRARYLGDPDFVKMPVARLTSLEYARQLAATISRERAVLDGAAPETGSRSGGNTTHYSIIDSEGNRVSATMSINYSFGAGLVVPETGVLLNNEMDDFVTKPGVPNLYGLVGGEANAIAPGKRMLSSMSPTFVVDGQRIAILGTPGGSRIITMVALAILDFLEGDDAKTIVSGKRFHHQHLPDVIEFEPQAFDSSLEAALRGRGHRLKPLPDAYGNMQAVLWNFRENRLDAASDPRGIGTARIQ